MRRVLIFPGISFGSAVWWLGSFAVVPLFTILSGVAFWTLATFGLLTFRLVRRSRRRDAADQRFVDEEASTTEESVRSRVESLP